MATIYRSRYSGAQTDALLEKLENADFDEFAEMYNEVVEDYATIDEKISSASDVTASLNGAISSGTAAITSAAATATSATAAAQAVLDSIPADYSSTVAQVSTNTTTISQHTTAIAQKGQKPVNNTATLSSSSWSSNSITVSVTGVTSSNTVIVAPSDRTSAETWGDCEVMCTAQASGTLTFTCSDTPSENITVSVVILS